MAWHKSASDVLAVMAEVAWLYLPISLVSGLFGVGGRAVSLPLALAAGLGAFYTARWVAALRLPVGPERALGVVLASASVYLVMGFQSGEGIVVFRAGWPVEVAQGSPLLRLLILGSVGTILLWRSGARLGLAAEPGDSLPGTFRTGVPIAVLGAIVHAIAPQDFWIPPAIYLFFGSALLGFALERMASVGLGLEGGKGTWGRLLGGSVAVVLGGSLLAVLLSETLVGRAITTLLQGALALLGSVAYVFGLLGGYVAEFIISLLPTALWRNMEQAWRRMRERLQEIGDFQPRGEPSQPPEWIPIVAKWAAISLAVAGAILILALLFRARRRAVEQKAGEERASLEDQGSLTTDLTALMGHLLRRMGRRGRRAAGLLLPLEEARAAAYRLYFSLLALARRRGVGRAPSETPREFQRRTAAHLPAEETAQLTEAFSRARYGGYPPSPEQVVELEAAWLRIREEPKAEAGRPGEAAAPQ